MSWFARQSASRRYILIAAATAALIGAITLWWIALGPGAYDFAGGETVALADYRGPDPTGAPPELKHASLVQRGEYLARAADCVACHTAKGGEPYAGGLSFVISIGTLYSPNITPDKETGIGNWSDAEFLNALHRGINKKGERLYPAMPFDSYAGITDADALAVKAYLFSLKPLHNTIPPTRMSFPFNQRWLMAIWSAFFNPNERFRPNAARSAEWNRGAYLAESLAHCGECHTPRNPAFALNNRRKFAGEIQAGWRAYNITQDKTAGVGSWSAGELAQYLSTGHVDGRGTAAGPMGDAVDLSFRHLTHGDIAAMVAYLQTVPAKTSRDLPAPKTTPAPASHRDGVVADYDPRGKALFAGACASCHDWTGTSPILRYATLTGARAVNDPTATNVAQIVLKGWVRDTPHGKVAMPKFGHSFSDSEVAAVANYVTARFGASPSHISIHEVALLRKQE